MNSAATVAFGLPCPSSYMPHSQHCRVSHVQSDGPRAQLNRNWRFKLLMSIIYVNDMDVLEACQREVREGLASKAARR